MTMEKQPFEDVYVLLKTVIFQCHVCFQGVELGTAIQDEPRGRIDILDTFILVFGHDFNTLVHH